jgi:hypothetical protein
MIELAGQFGTAQHIERRPVLDRSAGVVPFQFCEDADPRIWIEGLQFDEWGVADGPGDINRGEGAWDGPFR